MESQKSSVPSFSLNIEWNVQINEQEGLCLRVSVETVSIVANGPDKHFEHSLTLQFRYAKSIVSDLIMPALQCIDEQHHEKLIDALAFLFMAFESMRGDSIGTQVVNLLIG